MKHILFSLALLLPLACSITAEQDHPAENEEIDLSLKGLARMFAELPLEPSHLREVYDAVGSSSDNGYDEEYTLDCLVTNPGSGVGSPPGSKAAQTYDKPLRELISEYYSRKLSAPCAATKASVADETMSLMDELAASGYQLYWPYSEDWDGKTFPIITFDPGFGAESNYGYEVSYSASGLRIVDSVYVDEGVARRRPVWVLNSNTDSGFTPLELFSTRNTITASTTPYEISGDFAPAGRRRKLMMKSFKMLRNYDSWFGGASEFRVQMGSVDGFSASTEAELKLYNPSVTDFIIVVKRKYVGKELPYEAMLVSDFTSQLDKLAFLITEDDGGTHTNWKCEIVVKIQSKAYGLSVDIPYNDKDDIVWRGQLSAHFFEEEDIVTARFGDVVVGFELE